jgi:hypothetical protein
MKFPTDNPKAVASRMIYLAWKASRLQGLGFLQDQGDQTEEQVFAQAYHRGDYPGGRDFMGGSPDEVSSDYVFGRMVKLYMKVHPDGIEVRDDTPSPDHQSWCHAYPTYDMLFAEAKASL